MLEAFVNTTSLPVSADEAFAWHARPGAFERLTPPWAPVRVLDRRGVGIGDGVEITLEVPIGPFRSRWVAVHGGLIPGRRFCDVARGGPFAVWEHTHEFEPATNGSILRDAIRYKLLGGMPGRILGRGYVRRELERTFRYRHAVTLQDLTMHAQFSTRPRMRVAVSGATGLIGAALCALLSTGGHSVLRLVRRAPASADEAEWSPERGVVDAAALAGVDAVVHLAGRGIASGRWTSAVMDDIRRSRVDATRALVRSLGALPSPPRHFICASAVGYYGHRGDEVLSESSSAGTGFLVDVSKAWEREASAAAEFGARVALARIGVVLSPKGGMLATLLPIFNLGMGGPVGDGKQFISWISIDDVIGALHHVLMTPAITGPVNLVAPNPATNTEFARTLGRVLHRPAFMWVPATAARLAAGAMADETVLASVRATPGVLTAQGYEFRHATLESALRHVLGR